MPQLYSPSYFLSIKNYPLKTEGFSLSEILKIYYQPWLGFSSSCGADYPLQGAPQKSSLSTWKPFRHGERKDKPSTRRLRARWWSRLQPTSTNWGRASARRAQAAVRTVHYRVLTCTRFAARCRWWERSRAACP